MQDYRTKSAVALIVFNRPDTTKKVLAEIARAKPPKLFVIADGPRNGRTDEEKKCNEVRALINSIDWDCEVLTNYSEKNLGCKRRVSSGLNWVFENVPEAIILEDDCLPHPTFFKFCDELLEYYREDTRVGMISGDNFQFGRKFDNCHYYFSRYSHIWGWATWSRAWKYYDVDMLDWISIREKNILESIFCKNEVNYWTKILDAVYKGEIDTWDYQWCLTNWVQNMLSVVPSVNLISNIGFGDGATHTTQNSKYSNMEIEGIKFPINHPRFVINNFAADEFTSAEMFNKSLAFRLLKSARKLITI